MELKSMPYIDNLVSDVLSMCKGITVKYTAEANNYDTVDIIRDADYYIAATNNTDTFMTYQSYPVVVLRTAGLTDEQIKNAQLSKMNIPEDLRQTVLNEQRKHVKSTFVEKNDYYRMLNGKSSIKGINRVRLYDPVEGVDISKYVDDMTDNEILLLDEAGVIDDLKKKNPEYRYLNYLGVNKIPIAKARQANNFDILQIGPSASPLNKAKFYTNYEYARRYVMTATYNPLKNADQDYYDSYIALMIVTQAMHQCINDSKDIITNREYENDLIISYVLQSYALDIFDDIPHKYRKKIAHNIDRLINVKGTDKIYKIIYEIFGFSSVNVYEYFIMKSQKRDEQGEPIFDPDPAKQYDLSMSQVNIDSENVSLDIREQSNILDFDAVVNKDTYWGVYKSNEAIKSDLLKSEFNYINSKYIAINTAYDQAQMNQECSYVMNVLLDLKKFEKNVKVVIGDVENIALFDAFMYVNALIAKDIGYGGNIPQSMAAVSTTYGFNVDRSRSSLEEIFKRYKNIQPVTIDGVMLKVPIGDVIDSGELLSFYFDNKAIYDILSNVMQTTKVEEEYMLCSELMRYLMTSKRSLSIYAKPDGSTASTYQDYLFHWNKSLYDRLMNTEKSACNDEMIFALGEIDRVVGDPRFKFMFTDMPIIDPTIINEQILKVISVFKSYTVDLTNLSMVYDYDSPLMNTVRTYDGVTFNATNYYLGKQGATTMIGSELATISSSKLEDKVMFRDGITFIK